MTALTDVRLYRHIEKGMFITLLAFTIAIHFILLIPGVDSSVFLYGSMLISKGHLPYLDMWDNKPPLIYCLGLPSRLLPSNPFLIIRLMEVALLLLNTYIIGSICKFTALGYKYTYQLVYLIIYLIFWKRGFLTETFFISLLLLIIYVYIKQAKHRIAYGSLILVLSFFLKPNSPAVFLPFLFADCFYKHSFKTGLKRAALYAVFTIPVIASIFLAMRQSIAYPYFIEQVFQCNINCAKEPGTSKILLLRKITAPHYLIIHASVLLATGIYIFRRFIKNVLTPADNLILLCIISYIIAIASVLSSGKFLTWYFLFAIIQAVFTIGYIINQNKLAYALIIPLLYLSIKINFEYAISYYSSIHAKKELISYIKKNTKPDEYIYTADNELTYLYTTTGRLSNTMFIAANPFMPKWGFQDKYLTGFKSDMQLKPPALIIYPDDTDSYEPVAYRSALREILLQYHITYTGYRCSVYRLNKLP